jgi:hypothetical protein
LSRFQIYLTAVTVDAFGGGEVTLPLALSALATTPQPSGTKPGFGT